jgi:hypothetical protein
MRSAILKIVVGCMIGFHTDALAIGPLCAVTSSLVSVSSCNNARLDDDEDTDDDASNREERKLPGLLLAISSRELWWSNATRQPRSVQESTSARKICDLNSFVDGE